MYCCIGIQAKLTFSQHARGQDLQIATQNVFATRPFIK